jgi:hypothetical protein
MLRTFATSQHSNRSAADPSPYCDQHHAVLSRFAFFVALLVLAGCGPGGWKTVETPHVRLTTQVSQARAEEVALQLEEAHVALSEAFFDCTTSGARSRV